jgi:glucose-1-phosphate adenylyltransferase
MRIVSELFLQMRISGTSFQPKLPSSNLINMGVYVFNLRILNEALLEDHERKESSHDFGKDVLPRLVEKGARVYAFPYTGYWMDVGTVNSYWQAHMDQLLEKPPLDMNDRSWIIHTRTEERPPSWISKGAIVSNSMITDGCVIHSGAHIECSVLSPGVVVNQGAMVRESVLLTDTKVESNATIERTIIDKRVFIGENAHIGGYVQGLEPLITMIGKNSQVPAGYRIEPGAAIATDVIPTDYPGDLIRSNDYIQTKRLAYEV